MTHEPRLKTRPRAQMARFREMLKVAGRADKVVRERVKKADLQRLQPAYEVRRCCTPTDLR
jgi:hypothetical protein